MEYVFRKFTPAEVRRTFGLADGWTEFEIAEKATSEDARKKALGISIIANILEVIGKLFGGNIVSQTKPRFWSSNRPPDRKVVVHS